MITPSRSRSSGLDISLLGALLAIVSFYAAGVTRVPGDVPNLIRFLEKPPGTHYAAGTPQDAALLLLLDPSTAGSTRASAGLALPAGLESVFLLLAAVGLAMVVAGPIWARVYRDG